MSVEKEKPEMPIVELPSPAQEVYADGILAVSHDGNNFTITFTTERTIDINPPKIQRAITARLILPAPVLEALFARAKALHGLFGRRAKQKQPKLKKPTMQ